MSGIAIDHRNFSQPRVWQLASLRDITVSLDLRLRGVVVIHFLCKLRSVVDFALTHNPQTADLGLKADLCYPRYQKPKTNTDWWRRSQGLQDIRERCEGSVGSERYVGSQGRYYSLESVTSHTGLNGSVLLLGDDARDRSLYQSRRIRTYPPMMLPGIVHRLMSLFSGLLWPNRGPNRTGS